MYHTSVPYHQYMEPDVRCGIVTSGHEIIFNGDDLDDLAVKDVARILSCGYAESIVLTARNMFDAETVRRIVERTDYTAVHRTITIDVPFMESRGKTERNRYLLPLTRSGARLMCSHHGTDHDGIPEDETISIVRQMRHDRMFQIAKFADYAPTRKSAITMISLMDASDLVVVGLGKTPHFGPLVRRAGLALLDPKLPVFVTHEHLEPTGDGQMTFHEAEMAWYTITGAKETVNG